MVEPFPSASSIENREDKNINDLRGGIDVVTQFIIVSSQIFCIKKGSHWR